MVPRLSAPAITSARRTPGIGCSTTVVTADSHWPAIPLTSSLCLRTSASISGLLPMVPIRTTSIPAAGLPFINGASCPVTLPISRLRSPAARTTPGQSSSLTTSGAALPFAASTKAAGDGDVLTYFGPPRALPASGHRAIAKRTRKAARAVCRAQCFFCKCNPEPTRALWTTRKRIDRCSSFPQENQITLCGQTHHRTNPQLSGTRPERVSMRGLFFGRDAERSQGLALGYSRSLPTGGERQPRVPIRLRLLPQSPLRASFRLVPARRDLLRMTADYCSLGITRCAGLKTGAT